MKKMLLTLVCAAFLSGCATTGGVDQAKLDALVAQIQAYAQTTCGLLPAAASVIEVIGGFSGTPGIGTTVATVGGAICNGFVTRQARLGGALTVNVNTPKGVIRVAATRVR